MAIERMLQRAAPTLRVAGAILLAAGMLHLYCNLVLFDAATFGARAAQSLRDPRVAAFVSERAADEAIAQKRDLVAFRPVLVGTVRGLVSSEAFAAGFRRAAQAAHTALFSQGAERIALSVPDVGVILKSALAQNPGLAAKVPARLQGSLLKQPTGRGAELLVEVVRLAHRSRRVAALGIGLGVAMLVVGIAGAQDRRRALLHGGSSLAVVALVLFFLPPLARTVLTLTLVSPAMRPVAAGVFDAFTGGLRLWALALAGIGLVLAAAASSFASHLEVEDVGRRAWQRLNDPARSRAGELLRGLLLTATGLLAVARPTATLQGLAVIAGALVAFEGLRTLFLVLPPHGEGGAHAPVVAEGNAAAFPWLRAAVVGVLAIALVAAAILFMRSPEAMPRTAALTETCNGDRALCGKRLDEVVFAGAHNAMSAAEFSGWMFPNQEVGPAALLERGVRALLIDAHYGSPVSDRVKTDLPDEGGSRVKFEKAIGKDAVDAAMRIRDRLTEPPSGPRAAYLCHGFCELGAQALTPELARVHDFLVANPGEVVVLVIEDYVSPEDLVTAFRESGLERLVYRGPVTPPFPTLRAMIDADERVVVFGENDARAAPWYHPAFDSIQETPYTFRTPAEFSCRANRGGAAAPFFQINHWIETTPTPKPSNAVIVNAHDFLLARARQCQQERGRLPNILAVDFATIGDVVAVAAEMNGVGAAR